MLHIFQHEPCVLHDPFPEIMKPNQSLWIDNSHSNSFEASAIRRHPNVDVSAQVQNEDITFIQGLFLEFNLESFFSNVSFICCEKKFNIYLAKCDHHLWNLFESFEVYLCASDISFSLAVEQLRLPVLEHVFDLFESRFISTGDITRKVPLTFSLFS